MIGVVMKTKIKFRNATLHRVILFTLAVSASAYLPTAVSAQSVSSPGRDWSGGWGFSSPSDRSLRLQEAQAIHSIENPYNGPGTVIYNTTTNDYRSNYQDIQAGAGAIGPIEFRIGDEIGQNTNSVGSMNTGSTTIEVSGEGNIIEATNSSESNGCIDGSVQNGSYSVSGNMTEGSLTLPGFSVPRAACE